MKRSLILCVFLLGIVVLSAKERVIENPHFSVGTHGNVVVEKVTLTDDATLLHIVIGHSPSSWIRIDSKTYIQVDGNKLLVESADGIELDKEVYSDETNKTHFVLRFPAIDPKTKTLDFIETDCDNCFKIWGINLDVNATFKAIEIPQHIKDLAVIKDDGNSLEVPVIKEGIATLKGVLLGYIPNMNLKVQAFVNNPVIGKQEELETMVNPDGTFELKVPLLSTTQVLLWVYSYFGKFLLSPGQESILYFDIHQKSYQETMNDVLRRPASKYLFWGGANADINNQMEDLKLSKFVGSFLHSEKKLAEIVGMNASQYKAYMLQKMNDGIENLSDKGLTKKAKEFAIINFRAGTMYELFIAGYMLREAYRIANKLGYEDDLSGFEYPEFDAEYYSFLKELDLNNPINLYSADFDGNINSTSYLDINLAETLGTSQGIAFDLIVTQKACRKMEEYMPLTEEDFQQLGQLDNPFYLKNATEKNNQLLAELEQKKGAKEYTIHDTPASDGEQLFTDIVKPFEGKVVMVDFWATWCGPCRAAMKEFESAKEELKEKGVVFVYLTDESSPLTAWQNMIQGISGEHFRMTSSQFTELKNKFGVRGIPSYLILNKKGEKVYFSVGFEGTDKLSRILNEELNK